MTTVSLSAACVLLAAGVTFLLIRRSKRSAVAGMTGLAFLAGAVILGLGIMNVIQFTRASGGMTMTPTGHEADGAARATKTELKRLSTPLLPNADDREVVDRFSQLFYDADEVWTARNWLGIPTYQNPNDVWMHQELIVTLKPDYIIETGTAAGGSAILWAMILKEVNPTGKVITLDINEPSSEAQAHPLWKQHVEFIKGSSTDPAIVARLTERVLGKNMLVILDSDHSKAHVLNELKAYSALVPMGGYLIVQDTSVNGHPVFPDHGPGPMEAVDEFLASDDRFVSDRTREALLFTLHPKGYLKRVK